jgi:glucokinase
VPGDLSAISSVHAFDIGGSHISAACCALRGLRILRTARVGLPPDPTAGQFLDLLCELSRAVTLPDAPGLGAVLAVPGPFDLTAGISRMRHKLRSLYGVDLRAALAERFGWDPAQVSFINDAAGFLLGEIQCGAARGAKKAIGIVLGTGIGSAFARDGDWVTHGEGIPPGGEIWNLPYGPGKVEDLLSTRALKAGYAARTGVEREVITIAGQADSDPDALAVFQAFGSNLGQMIRDVLAPFGPDVVVLGGGISISARLFLPFAQNSLNGLGFKLVTSNLLDEATLLGAAAYWRNGSDTSIQ